MKRISHPPKIIGPGTCHVKFFDPKAGFGPRLDNPVALTPLAAMSKPPKISRQQVFTLLVQIGRKDGDGLPKGATGGALMCFSSGIDEAEAVRETVAILKKADLAPLDVTGYGTLQERLDEGHDISDEERELMDRALAENSVVIAQMTPFFED